MIALAVVAGVVGLIILAVLSARKAMARLVEQLRRLGWHTVADYSPAPPPVIRAARSRRTVLLLHHPQTGTWLCWHRWTEMSAASPGNVQTTRTLHLTSYFHAVDGSLPEVSVAGRTAIGGFLKARRGVGTGDDDFDRRFVVKPTGDPRAAAIVTPQLARALLAGEVPNFAISSGVVVTSYRQALDPRHVPQHTGQINRLAHLLTH